MLNLNMSDNDFIVPPLPEGTSRAEPYSGGCSLTMDFEKDSKLDVYGTINIRFGQQFSRMRPDPSRLFNAVVRNDYPMVIDPAGEVLIPSHNPDLSYQFTDNIARIWAQQNNGIYFPSRFGKERTSILFNDFIKALERVRPNYQRRNGSYEYDFQKSAHELSSRPGWLNDLALEARYLDDVHVFNPINQWGESGGLIGLEGVVHKREGSEPDTNFGSNENWFRINLGLDLRGGFGTYHFNVSRRVLSATVGQYSNIRKDSDEEIAIMGLVNEFEKKDERYNFDVTPIRLKERNGNWTDRYDRIVISMESPRTQGYENEWDKNSGRLKRPVMQTREMIDKFIPLMTNAVEGLDRLDKHKKEVEIERGQQIYKVFRGTS